MTAAARRALPPIGAIVILLALRVPSIAQPAGADQSLYIYAGQRLLSGDAPYATAWDQKPPGIHLIYGALWRLWPNEAVVGAADLTAAALVTVFLVALGRRLSAPGAGWLAAVIFLLLAHPSLQRLGGVFVRGQSETFIAVFVTLGLMLALSRTSGWWPRAAAGVCLGLAIGLKYNAAVYALPVAIAMRLSRGPATDRSFAWRDLAAMLAGVVAVGVAGLIYLAAHDSLTELRLATLDYNLQYSADSYEGTWSFVGYVTRLPVRQARHDLLWFLGGAGLLLAFAVRDVRPAATLSLTWIAAAVLSIAINSGRDLPQYFVQASPALALAAGAGFAGVWEVRRRMLRATAVALLALGLWRVGADTPLPPGVRLGGLPGLVANVRFDLDYLRGRIDRTTYLERFGGQRERDKFAALDVERLAALARDTTAPADTILVFGFSPGIYVKSARRSASRFFWSRPIVIGFAADRPGYGVAGLLDELTRARPALVMLQKRDWGPAEPDSEAFFLSNPTLTDWLHRRYRLDGQQRLYSIWRRLE